MKKEEFIKRYGEAAYEKQLEQSRERNKKLREANPNKVIETNHNVNRKGGKYYEKMLKYNHAGLRCERKAIRGKHQKRWQYYKKMIAPGSQLHHQWKPGTSKYDGVALVDPDAHQHGIINVIRVLDGTITVFREKDLQGGII